MIDQNKGSITTPLLVDKSACVTVGQYCLSDNEEHKKAFYRMAIIGGWMPRESDKGNTQESS